MSARSGPARGGWRAGLGGELSAEFLGTFVLLAFGCGVVAVTVAGLPGSGRTLDPTTNLFSSGDWLLITWGWALAVTFGVYVAGGVTGAHINPAVTLALAVKGDFEWKKVLPYIAAQMVGAFLGAALVLLVYFQAIGAFEVAAGIDRAAPDAGTGGIFYTSPAPYYGGGYIGPLIDQIVGTMFLVIFVLALIDSTNLAPKANLTPLLVGLAVGAIGMSFGANAGYAINPARDLGPRTLAWLGGWDGAFASAGYYFWVPIIGPLIGGVIAVFVYKFFIADVLAARGVQPYEDIEAVGEVAEEKHGQDGAASETREQTTPER